MTWIRWMVVVNLGLVALQPVSAGFILSGYGGATAVHRGVAAALLVGVLVQAVSAVVLWARRRAPVWVAGFSAVLFVAVLVQAGLGYRDLHWLHVPIGVGLFGALTRQLDRLRGTGLGASARAWPVSGGGRPAGAGASGTG